jgi:hypothetical protein
MTMVMQTRHQRHERTLVLGETPLAPHASPAEAAYFTGLLDTGDQQVSPTEAMPRPAAAPTVAAYFLGLLDVGDE